MRLRSLISRGLDFVYPRSCVSCGAQVEEQGRHLCWDCHRRITLIQFPFCRWCGDPVQGQIDASYVCAWCVRHAPAYDRARSAALYQGTLQACIKAFKYGRATYLVPELGTLLAGCVDVHYREEVIDAVTYVPLHRRRKRERTFNQSHVLARHVARGLGVEVSDAGLYRIMIKKWGQI